MERNECKKSERQTNDEEIYQAFDDPKISEIPGEYKRYGKYNSKRTAETTLEGNVKDGKTVNKRSRLTRERREDHESIKDIEFRDKRRSKSKCKMS